MGERGGWGEGGLGEGGGRGRVGGVRVDVIEKLKFLGKFTKKNGGGLGGWGGGLGRGGGGGSGWWGGMGQVGGERRIVKFL